jgi:hypothetical protein
MHEDYPRGGSFADSLQVLIQQADADAAMHVIVQDTQPTNVASLREIGQKDPADWLGQCYARSTNMMYRASIEKMEAISRAINDGKTVTIADRVFDGIKAASRVEFTDSLPIAYKKELSGAFEDDEIPGYVIRGNEHGVMFTLWEVSGLENKNGSIVTANQEDWCVRETIEYVAQEDQ